MPRPGLSKTAVVAEAARLADERGWERLSLAELAARFGVKPPSLYNHIASLEALRRELAIVALHELAAALGKAAIGRSGDDAVRALALAYRDFVKRRPGLYQATIRAADPKDKELAQADNRVVEVSLAALGAYRLDRKTALHALRAIRSAAHGFATLEIAGGFGIPLSIERSFEWLVNCCILGLHQSG